MHKRRLLTYVFVAAGLTIPIAAAPAADDALHHASISAQGLALETLSGQQLEKMLLEKKVTSVALTEAYIARIDALNKSGPGLNAVTQLNPNALKEAALADKERAAGKNLGPAMGLPILLKDIVDATPMYTSAGNYSLRDSFPEEDSGVAKKLRQHGVVILGKTGLSEFANSFGNQPSGFSNLTGQVINAIDADQNPSGSSSGSASAAASALAALTIGTETSGSIISPSSTQGVVGLRPTVGLVPGYGIAPIDASQDTAGPIVRTVADAAMTLQSIAGPDTESDTEYKDVFGPDYLATGVIPTPPKTVPDYMSALDLNFVKGKRIGYNGTLTPGSALQEAYDALVAAGATMVLDPQTTVAAIPAVPSGYEPHKTIDEYYKHLGPKAPIQSLVQEVVQNQAEAHEALKFGNATHLSESQTDITPGGTNEQMFRTNLPIRKAANHKAIDDMMTMGTADPSDDVIGVLGSVPSGPQAGYPQITVPMGYNTTTRRTVNVSINGGAYDERNLIGIAYVIEQKTHLRQPVGDVDPSMYRCAHTTVPEPFAKRGHCNPDLVSISNVLGGIARPVLPFSLETTSVQSLESMLAAGTLTSLELVDAYLYRIGLTNADGPAIQAVRAINPAAIAEAKASDALRKKKVTTGPLMGIPVLVDDSIDVKGMPTTGGSIALENNMPAADSTIVANLKKAGAIILGKTNVTELDGLFDANIPEGYSSLGGQVLLPSDTDKTPAGSSAGSAAATAAGLAALTIGMETSPDTAQLIAPAAAAGVVGLKPTVGVVSQAGVLPVSKAQDSPGPIGRTVYDVAAGFDALTGSNDVSGLSTSALQGKRIAVLASSTEPYPTMVNALQSQGATTVVVPEGTPSPNPPSVVATEFKSDLDAYLGSGHSGGAKSLQAIIDYNNKNAAEGLKYEQGELLAAEGINLSDTSTAATFGANLIAGKASNAAVIDNILNNGTPNNPNDDFDAVLVPSGDPLVGDADRAGYPVLTIPAGYGATNSSSGRDPIGVDLVGTANSEAKLLDDGYDLEQATKVRLAPSYTNPSMWRCVPGSTFFTAQLCNPGDPELKLDAHKVTDLSTLITSMGLDQHVTSDLTSGLGELDTKISSTTEQCSGIGLGDLVGKVIGGAGLAKPTISVNQAEEIVASLNGLAGSINCAGGEAGITKAEAEQNVLGLIGTLQTMKLDNGLSTGVRNALRNVGKQLAHNKVAHACVYLNVVTGKINGTRKLLTAAEVTQLRAARQTISSELGCG